MEIIWYIIASILAGVGTGVFASVEEAAKNIKIKDKYVPQDVDYSASYERYLKTDATLNVKN